MNEARLLLKNLQAQMDGRADAAEGMLLAAARVAGYWISADRRIGEADLATFLGSLPAAWPISAAKDPRRRSTCSVAPAIE